MSYNWSRGKVNDLTHILYCLSLMHTLCMAEHRGGGEFVGSVWLEEKKVDRLLQSSHGK